MRKNLKILSVIGIVMILLVMGGSDNWGQYILEGVGMSALALYTWKKINDKTIMLWVTGVFWFLYVFVNFSVMDFLYWALAFILVYREK